MLEDPGTLIGRLQRGRGDAVRELLAMPRETAGDVLVRCLCTEGDLVQNSDGYAELVERLAPDLTRWFAWIDGFGPDVSEDTRLAAFQLLGELVARGHGAARAFLRSYLLGGLHWQDALQVTGFDVDLERDVWEVLLPRLDEETLRVQVGCSLDKPLWDELAASDERFAAVLRRQRECRAQQQARTAWSEANYAEATLSQRRWRVLESLLAQDPAAAAPLLIDGLWDACSSFRERCIERCDLAWPGVRERLAELAAMPRGRAAAKARARLG